METIDLQAAQREEARWRIMRTLDAGRPSPVSETLILHVLNDNKLHLSPGELRRQLDYLEHRELLKVLDRESPVWSAELTRVGIDVVEYTCPCDPGIARPPR